MSSVKKLIYSGIISNFIGLLGKKLLAIIISIVIIKALSVSEYGVFNLFIGMLSFFATLSFGVDKVFQRYFPMLDKNHKNNAIGLFYFTLIARYIVYFVIVLAFYAAYEFNFIDVSKFNFKYYSLTLVIGLLFIGHVFLALGLNSAYLENVYLNVVYVAGDFLKIILYYVFLNELNTKLTLLIWGIGEGFIFILILYRFLYKSKINLKYNYFSHWKNLEYKRYFHYAKYMVLATTGTYILTTQVDNFFISYFHGNESVGLYSFASKLPFLLLMFAPCNIMQNVYAPLVFRQVDNGRPVASMSVIVSAFVKANLLIWTFLILCLLINLEWVIVYLFDDKYLDTKFYIYIWCFVLYASVIKNVYEPIARAVEYSNVFLYVFIAALINIIGDFFLVPIWNIDGALCATSFALIFQGFYMSYSISKYVNYKICYNSIFKFIIYVLLLFASIFYLKISFNNNFLNIVLINSVSIILYCILFYPKFWFTKEEFLIIREYLPRRFV